MTIGDLRRILNQFSDEQTIIFTPDKYCGEGYPEWKDVDITSDINFVTGEPIGTVTASLMGEQ